MPIRLSACILALLASPAAAQDLSDIPLDCESTPGGAQCRLGTDGAEDAFLYCVAYDAAGDPIGNTTATNDEGVAVLNGVEAEAIARIACRVE